MTADALEGVKEQASQQFKEILCSVRKGYKPNYSCLLNTISYLQSEKIKPIYPLENPDIWLKADSEVVREQQNTVITIYIVNNINKIENIELCYTDQRDDHCIYRANKLNVYNIIPVVSQAITKDTIFTLKVLYVDGTTNNISITIKCAKAIHIGAIKEGQNFSDAQSSDPTNNQTYYVTRDTNEIIVKYKFQDPDLRYIYLEIPSDFLILSKMTTQSQTFTLEAFKVRDPFSNTTRGMVVHPGLNPGLHSFYTCYTYLQPLVKLDQEVIFHFSKPSQEVSS